MLIYYVIGFWGFRIWIINRVMGRRRFRKRRILGEVWDFLEVLALFYVLCCLLYSLIVLSIQIYFTLLDFHYLSYPFYFTLLS